MRLEWITAAILSSALVAGCGDRNTQNTQNPPNGTGSPAASDQSAGARDQDEVSPDRDTGRDRSLATTGTRRDRFQPGDRDQRPLRPGNQRLQQSERGESASTVERPASAVPEYREVTIPAGTSLPLELLTPLASDTAQVETPVRARLRNAVLVNGTDAIPEGTVFTGTVTDAEQAGRVKGRSHLAFQFTDADIRGVRERLRTNPVTFEGESSTKSDATKIGVGAGIGAAIGGILGGGKGAAEGAAIGGGAGTGAVLATRGKEVTLAEGADVPATLADAVTLRVPLR